MIIEKCTFESILMRMEKEADNYILWDEITQFFGPEGCPKKIKLIQASKFKLKEHPFFRNDGYCKEPEEEEIVPKEEEKPEVVIE